MRRVDDDALSTLSIPTAFTWSEYWQKPSRNRLAEPGGKEAGKADLKYSKTSCGGIKIAGSDVCLAPNAPDKRI